MLRAPLPVRTYEFTFSNGDVTPQTVPAENAHHIRSVIAVKLEDAGGAADAVAVSIGGTACASFNLNGVAFGTVAVDSVLGVLVIGKGEQIVVTPTVGAGNSAVRVFLDVVDA